jgi:hypothetical protein
MDKWDKLKKHYTDISEGPDEDADEVLFALEVLDLMESLEEEQEASNECT